VPQRGEHGLVEALVAQAADEALRERVLLRLAGGDVVPADAALLRPAQDRRAGQLGAVVAHHRQRQAALRADRVQLARHPLAGQRGVGHQSQALVAEVVDHAQNPEPAAIGQRVGREVKRPAPVGRLRHRHRRPCADRPLASAAATHLQPLFAIKPTQPLVVRPQPLTRQQQAEATIAEPASLGGQAPQPGAQDTVIGPGASVADRAAVRAKE
jgi:hypothetical protein